MFGRKRISIRNGNDCIAGSIGSVVVLIGGLIIGLTVDLVIGLIVVVNLIIIAGLIIVGLVVPSRATGNPRSRCSVNRFVMEIIGMGVFPSTIRIIAKRIPFARLMVRVPEAIET